MYPVNDQIPKFPIGPHGQKSAWQPQDVSPLCSMAAYPEGVWQGLRDGLPVKRLRREREGNVEFGMHGGSVPVRVTHACTRVDALDELLHTLRSVSPAPDS